jgi:tetratricopeptide (TPR) repeat protein
MASSRVSSELRWRCVLACMSLLPVAAHGQITDATRDKKVQSVQAVAVGEASQQAVESAAVQQASPQAAAAAGVHAAEVDDASQQAAKNAATQQASPQAAAAAGTHAADQNDDGTTDTTSKEIARAQQLMRAGDVAQATTVLETARAQAVETGKKSEEASALFYMGVAQQARVQQEQLPQGERQAARTAAISAYQQSLQANPSSGPALNNLAQLYRADPATRTEADELFAKAIELDDSHKVVYLLNRSALKRDTGDPRAALALAEQAAAADPADLDAHRMVVEVASAGSSAAALLDYLEKLNAAGLVERALETAASALSKFPADRGRLLLSMGESLGNDAYTAWPPRFASSHPGEILQSFRHDPQIGAGVRELFAVLEKPVAEPAFTWWTRGYHAHYIEPGSPAPVMQNLLRRCAEIYRSRPAPANVAAAENYYRASISLSGPDTDARAFIGLAEMLYNANEIDQLGEILKRYEQGLYEMKGDAIAHHRDQQVFELRLALGMMYGYTKRWTSTQPRYANSIWMLENAQASADTYNRGKPPQERIGLPPVAVKMLSRGYEQTGNPNKSIEVRLDAADRYLALNQKERAEDVLDERWRGSLPSDIDVKLAQRLDRIMADMHGVP